MIDEEKLLTELTMVHGRELALLIIARCQRKRKAAKTLTKPAKPALPTVRLPSGKTWAKRVMLGVKPRGAKVEKTADGGEMVTLDCPCGFRALGFRAGAVAVGVPLEIVTKAEQAGRRLVLLPHGHVRCPACGLEASGG